MFFQKRDVYPYSVWFVAVIAFNSVHDQKPLATKLQKPLSQAPKRLQDLMMWYHRYNVNLAFVKDTDLP